MLEDFFRHTCDIYHHSDVEKTAKYGLPVSQDKNRTYPKTPSIPNVPCFFAADGEILAAEGRSTFDGASDISLPGGTVIHQGDKVVDLRFGIEYTAGFPEDIRGRYIWVPLRRPTPQSDL